MSPIRKIMIVAGEASGDAHAAKLVEALRENFPEIVFEFFGATGAKMRAAGVVEIVNADRLAIVGLPEIARALPMFWSAFRKLKRAAMNRKPDAVVLVDFPDFNLKLAKSLHRKNVKIIYYISPQLWAWRGYRIKTIEKSVDLLLTILPFENDWYNARGVSHVRFVGNPLAREVFSGLSKEEFCRKHNLEMHKPIVALLPGSRQKEIARILPPMLETAASMNEKNQELQFVIASASAEKTTTIKALIARAARQNLKLPESLTIVENETREVLNAADAAAVTSGTATLETAILGTPMAIVYKTSRLNYALLRPLISVEHFGLINLIARRRLVKEFIQDEFTSEVLAAELFRLLEQEENKRTRENLRAASGAIGRGGASNRAAEEIIKFLNG